MIRNPVRIFSLPLLPFVVSLILGAMAGGGTSPWTRSLLCAVFLILLAIGLLWQQIPLSKNQIPLLLGCFAVAFYTVYGLLHPIYSPSHISKWVGRPPRIVEGRLQPPLDPGLNRTVLMVRADRILNHAQKQWPARGTIRLTVYGPLTQALYVGDRLRFVTRLHRPPPPRNPATFDFQRFLALRGIYMTASLQDASKLIVIDNATPSWPGRIDRIRQRLDHWIRSSVPPPTNALASALLIGYRGKIPPPLRDVFRKTGTAHLIAISGLHLGIVAVFLFFVIRWLIGRFPSLFLYLDVQRFTAVLTVAGLVFYLFLSGNRLSTLRAFIMAATYLTVLFFRRTTRLEDVFLLAVFILLLFQPQAIFDSAFQLTFAAVGGILLGVSKPGGESDPSREESPPGTVTRWVRTTLWITFLAMAATFPIVGTSFHRVSLIGLPANFLAVPFVSFAVLPVGILALILYLISTPLATWLILLEGKLLLILTTILKHLSRFSYAQIHVFPFRWYEILLYYTVFVFAILSLRGNQHQKRKKKAVIAITALTLLLVSWILPHWFRKPTAEIFSVQKGTYIACIGQKGHTVLVCNGLGDSVFRDDAKWTLIPTLLHKRIRVLDALVVTNDTPVNLRTVAGILTYATPKYILGPRNVLYALKAVIPPEDLRVTFVTVPRSLKTGSVIIRWPNPVFHTVGIEITGLRIDMALAGKKLVPKERTHPDVFLSASGPSPPSLRGGICFIRYPGMFTHYGKKGHVSKGTFDLRRDGAVMMERSKGVWHLTTFTSHRHWILGGNSLR